MEQKQMEGFEPMEHAEAFEDHELGWDDEIEKDTDYILLAEGDYSFTVESFERARHNGSEKLPACNKAIVYLKVKGRDVESGREGEVTIRHQLFLHSKTEGMLCAFFTGIGQRKKGERMKMNWNLVPGSTGKAKIGIREYNGRKFNEVKKFYDPADTPVAPSQPTHFDRQGGF